MKIQINVEIEKGTKMVIDKLAKKGNISITQFINQAILNYIPYYERGFKRQRTILSTYLTAEEQYELGWEESREEAKEETIENSEN